MRKAIVLALVLALIGSAFAAPAALAKKKKKKKAKPVATTLFLHGRSQVGEADLTQQWLDGLLNDMSPAKPAAGAPKSQSTVNYVGGPNTRCDGNGLLGTVWRGDLAGTVKGDVKLTLHTAALPAAGLSIGLFPDGAGACVTEGEGPPAAAMETANPAPGEAETVVVFKKVNFRAINNLVVQIASTPTNPSQSRIFYDSESHPSRLEFKCIPAKGKKCA